jgi:molybdopterin-guanine dinucleotide biosynthesis protein A
VILAGGKSTRLGGVPKAQLRYDGATLLQRAVAAARGAGRAVVVGTRPSQDRQPRSPPDSPR